MGDFVDDDGGARHAEILGKRDNEHLGDLEGHGQAADVLIMEAHDVSPS